MSIQLTLWSLPSALCLVFASIMLIQLADEPRTAQTRQLRIMVYALTLWAAMHLLRTLVTTVQLKIFATIFLLPGTMSLTAAYMLWACAQARVLPWLQRHWYLAQVPALVVLALAALPPSRALIWQELTLTDMHGFVGFTLQMAPLGRLLLLADYGFALVGMAILVRDAVRTPGRRRTSLLFALIGIAALPLQAVLRTLWLDGGSPVNLATLGIALTLMFGATLAWSTDRRMRSLSAAQILDGLPDALVIADREGAVIDLNGAAATLLKMPARELLGADVRTLLHLDPDAKVPNDLIEDFRLAIAGVTHRFDVSTSAVLDRQEQALARAWVLEDRSAYRENQDRLAALTDQLLAQKEALEQLNSTKRQFLSRCSDAMRDPLVLIQDEAQALRDSFEASGQTEAQGFMQEVVEGARHLMELVDQITFFERTGRETGLDPQATDVRTLLDSAVGQLRPLAEHKRIRMVVTERGALEPRLLDPVKVRQMVVNLVSNGIKFTPDGGNIVVSLSAEGPEVVIEVADDGIGIDPQDQERIFRPFEQIDGSLSRKYGGTGLGLALVHRLAQVHGGRITLTSELGSGTRFRLSLHAPPVQQDRQNGQDA
ncbi:MAG TPA: ATP-binding protein [Pseudomonadales bacterium]|nr:ATP-binding protein [Pseudomonadales bacterium]